MSTKSIEKAENLRVKEATIRKVFLGKKEKDGVWVHIV